MRGFWKVVLVVMLVGLVGLFVAGCAQKQSTQGTEQTLPEMKVASEIVYPPMEYVDETTKQNTGFDIDLVNAIGKVEGFKPVFTNMGFDGIVAAVKTNNVDFAISALTIKPDRQKEVDFSVPYYKSGLIIAVKKDDTTIKTFDDLKGKKLAAQIGTTGADYCKTIPGVSVKVFDHIPEALMEVKSGAAVALVNDLPVSAYYVSHAPNDYKLVGDLLTSEYYGIAVPKNKPDTLKKINDGLAKLKASGEYATLYKKWFGRDPEPFLPGEPPK